MNSDVTAVIVAAIGAIGVAVSALLINVRTKLAEIHVLVNSNLKAAVEEKQEAVKALAELNANYARLVKEASTAAATAAVEAIAVKGTS